MTSHRPSGQVAQESGMTDQPGARLKPRRRLFIVLCVVMGLWIAALVTMYFTTVWPQRHSGTSLPRENDVEDHRPTTMTG